MMKRHISLFLLVFLTFSIFLEVKSLTDTKTKDEVCKKSNKKYITPTEFGSLTAYVNSFSTSKGKIQTTIQNLLLGSGIGTSDIKDCLMDVIIYLILIFLGIIFLTVYPFLLSCFCCSCCIFNKNVTQSTFCGIIYYAIATSLLAVTIIGSVIGLASSGKFVSYFNGSSCSLLNFFYHTLEGEESTNLPKWGGVYPISSALEGTINTVAVVGKNYDNVFNDSNSNSKYKLLGDSKTEIGNHIDQIESKFKSNSYGNRKPIYLSLFNNKGDPSSLIGAIQIEYDSTIVSTHTLFTSLKGPLQTINQQTGTITSTLNGLISNFNSIGGLIDSVSNTIATNFVDFQNSISDYLVLGFNVLFGVFIGIGSVLVVLLSLFIFLRMSFLKIIIHVLWNICFILIFLGPILAGVLGLVSEIGNQVTPVIGYLLSPSYLGSSNSIFGGDQQTAGYINTCINGDGDLSKAMGALSPQTNNLSLFYTLSQQLEGIKKSFGSYTQSKAVTVAIKQMRKYQDNILLVSDTNGKTIQEMLEEIKKTNSNACIDRGVQNTSCNSSNNIINNGSSSCPSNNNDYCAFINNVHNDLNYLFQKTTTSTSSSNSNDYSLDKLNEKFTKGIKTMHELLDDSAILTNSIVEVLGPLLGNSSFFDLFVCSFIKSDLISFCDQFSNEFSSKGKTLCAACAISAIFSFVSIFFVAKSIYRISGSNPSGKGENTKNLELEQLNKTKKVNNQEGVVRYFQGMSSETKILQD